MALRPLNSVGGFSVGEVPANVIYSNGDFSGNKANFAGNVFIANTTPSAGLFTDNLYYSNGLAWDFQLPGGSNTQVQFNDNGDFGGSANFYFDKTSNTLTLEGNFNVSTIQVTNVIVANSFVGNLSNGNSRVSIPVANGNVITAVNNSNIMIVTSDGANLNGNLTATSNVTANGITSLGNLTVNNYIFTSGTSSLYIDPASGYVIVDGNVNPNTTGLSLGNSSARWDNLFANTGNFAANLTAGNTDAGNLLSANFANIAGNLITNNAQVNLELAGNTANFTGNVIVPNLTVNLELAGNTANFSGNVVTPNLKVNLELSGNTANFTGNVIVPNLTVNLELAGNTANFSGNVQVNNLDVNLELSGNTANFAGNVVTSNLTVNLELQANTANFDGNVVMDNWLTVGNTANVGNLRTDNLLYANGVPWDMQQAAGANFEIQFNLNDDFAASPNLTFNDTTQTLTITGNANVSGAVNTTTIQSGTNITLTANGQNTTFYANGNAVFPGTIVANTFSGNFSGNFTAAGSNTQVLFNDEGNAAGAAGLTFNKTTNAVSVVGNLTAANLIGPLANGNSSVLVYSNANVEISVAGTTNVATFTATTFYVVGDINSTTGNMLANGNVTANGTLNGANANVTGEGLFGSVKTANITAPTGNITISAAGSNENIVLKPTGTGAVDVDYSRVINVGEPTDPHDAATKEYVDALIGEGLVIHTPVRVESPVNLNATYAQGGTTPTVDNITGSKTIEFTAAHGLSVNDGIVFTNSFNGLIGGEAYWVYSTPSATSITVKDGYFGAEVTTLTNGTSLAESSRANPGVGATLTNAGTNAAIEVDGITLSLNDRVLIYSQTNGFENGIYTVTTVGDGSTPWVLTRATDADTYIPYSTLGLGKGSYVFISEGDTGGGESYVMTAPANDLIIGTDNIVWTQFSGAGSYQAGSGINITGTTISANVDNETTAIVSGNIVVKTSANLTTPNIGDATFSSLSWNTLSNGNITANNLSIGNIANITSTLTVGGNILGNLNIAANGNVSGNNLSVTNNASVGGNLIANFITSNNTIFTTDANVSGNTITNTLTVNAALSGNTANFSGNVIVPNLQVNLELAGNTANFAGNVQVNNLGVNLELAGNTANFTGNVILNNLTVNLELDGNTANFTGDIYAANVYANSGTVSANVLNTETRIDIGNTVINWATLTTTSIGLNQTIAEIPVSGITGIEFLVKGVDSTGSKYSVATVQAVTDGTSVDYSVFGTVFIGSTTGTLAVNVTGGNLMLQVTPSSTNSTVWTTQFRTI